MGPELQLLIDQVCPSQCFKNSATYRGGALEQEGQELVPGLPHSSGDGVVVWNVQPGLWGEQGGKEFMVA